MRSPLFRLLVFALVGSACAASPEAPSTARSAAPLKKAKTSPEGQIVWGASSKLEMFFVRRGPARSSAVAVVMLHPWGLDHRVWTVVGSALAEDRPVIMVDLPAHGRSDKSWTRYSMSRLARAVVDVMDSAQLPRAILVGNSLGGATALEVARRAPTRVERLVLIGSPGGSHLPPALVTLARQVATADNLASLSDQAWQVGIKVATRSWHDRSHATVEAILAARRDEDEWRAFAQAATMVLNAVVRYTPDLEAVSIPALVVHGEKDPVIAEHLSEALADSLSGGRLVRLPNCGHLPELECPSALLEVLKPFLRRPAASGGRASAP